MAKFLLKEDLPQETRKELDRVLAIASAQRTSVEAAFIAQLDADYQYNEVLDRNAAGEITHAAGRTIPNGDSGFAVGAKFIVSNATTPAPITFENIGDATEADFKVVGNIEMDEAPAATVAATLTTALAGDDNDLVFTAVPVGVLGNEITIAYVDPEDDDIPLAVAVDGSAITVTLETDSEGEIISTAADILAAIEASEDASALVTVDDAAENDGSGVVIALAATALADGVDAFGMGFAQPGAIVADYDTPTLHMNTGTKLLPVWTDLLA